MTTAPKTVPLSTQYRINLTIDANPLPHTLSVGPIPGSLMTQEEVVEFARKMTEYTRVLDVEIVQRAVSATSRVSRISR